MATPEIKREAPHRLHHYEKQLHFKRITMQSNATR